MRGRWQEERGRRVAGLVFAAGLLAAGLAGCNAEYTVKVHNEGPRPVRVSLVQDRLVDDPAVLASVQVGPGREATLGPVKAPMTDDVTLEVESGEMGLPAGKHRLSSGKSEYRVGEAGSMGWGPAPIREGGAR